MYKYYLLTTLVKRCVHTHAHAYTITHTIAEFLCG